MPSPAASPSPSAASRSTPARASSTPTACRFQASMRRARWSAASSTSTIRAAPASPTAPCSAASPAPPPALVRAAATRSPLSPLFRGEREKCDLSSPVTAVTAASGLVNAVRWRVHEIRQPVLLVHPRQDDRANIANSFWLQRHLAGPVSMVVLNDSYHVITMDRQRQLVADRTVAFA